MEKKDILNYYTQNLDEEVIASNDIAKYNKNIKKIRTQLDDFINENYSIDKRIENILMNHYISFVKMIDYRNNIRPYEYMDFSRRIGELWEPFCKLCWKYPKNSVKIIEPIKFIDAKYKIEEKFNTSIKPLKINDEEKENLLNLYNELWTIVSSGTVNLSSDLHFILEDYSYNIDFKSGFNSNEKGNLNRLLLVGRIYNLMNKNYKNMILVRSSDNNNYLEILKKSKIWEVYSGDECYCKINELTGVNIKKWIENNVNWLDDLAISTVNHISENKLEKYLQW